MTKQEDGAMALAHDAARPDYRYDFAAWLADQSAALRAGRWADLDIEHITEELDGLGISQRHAIKSQLERMQLHLLEQAYQPERESDSWQRSIRDALIEIEKVLEDSPSLRREMPDFIAAAYRTARKKASNETDLPIATFPAIPTPEFELALSAALTGADPT
jgi:hypothetical protein